MKESLKWKLHVCFFCKWSDVGTSWTLYCQQEATLSSNDHATLHISGVIHHELTNTRHCQFMY